MSKLWVYEPASRWGVQDILEFEDGNFVSKTRKNFSIPQDFVVRHSSRFAFGGEGDADIPKARFKSLRELNSSGEMFKIEKTGRDLYAVRNVPLYKAHPDTRKYGIVCDEKFLDRMVKNFYQTSSATSELFGNAKFSWRPKLHWGHTSDNPDVEERENAGFIDNLYRVQDFLIGDYIALDKASLDKLVGGKYPDRSAEVDLRRARLLSVAALGFRTPHFALPQMNPQELREQYLAVIQKNAGAIREIEYSVLLGKDFPMPETKTKKSNRQKATLTGEQVAQFYMDMLEDEELHAAFEDAIEKHCGMPGMGGMMPQGPDLMGIISQLMMSQMASKMNSAPPGQAGQAGGGYGGGGQDQQRHASDVLDLESRSHHGSGEQDLDEEGTEVVKGKRGGDAGVKKDGTPDVEGTDDDTIDEGGDVVKKHTFRTSRARNMLKGITDRHVRDQVSALVEELISDREELTQFVEKQNNALTELTSEFKVQKNARRKDNFTNRFRQMFEAGNPNAANPKLIERHMKIAMNLGEEDADNYLKTLEAVPALPKGRAVSKNELIRSDADKNSRIERAKHTIERDRGLKKAGVTAAHLLAVDEVMDLLSGGEDEESDTDDSL